MAEEFLQPERRAEDIILGSVGIDGDAKIISIVRSEEGYRGVASWPDGEQIEFESDHELDELEQWALGLLTSK